MNRHYCRPITAAIYCMAVACTSALAASDTDRTPSRSLGIQPSSSRMDDHAASKGGSADYGRTVERMAAATGTAGQPTAGGNSAEPESTKKGGGEVGPTKGWDDRTVPNPTTGKPLPTQGGNSAEPDKTGKGSSGAGGVSLRGTGSGTAANPSKAIPSGGGNSAEPDKTGTGR